MTGSNQTSGSSTGPSIDRAGVPVIDTTQNVKDIIEREVNRLDDLRSESVLARDTAIGHVKEMMALQAGYVEKLMVMQASHTREMAESETSRVNAVRQVDVNNSAATTAQQLAAIQALAVVQAANADKLNNTLNTTAATLAKQTTDSAAAMATQTASSFAGITDRLAGLERSMYEGKGKGSVEDPLREEMRLAIKFLVDSRSAAAGSGEGMTKLIGWIFAGGAVLVAIGSLIFAAMK